MFSPTIIEGLVDFDVPTAGKPCKTWYKIVGDLSCGVTPLVIIHGGPGLTHHYVLPMIHFNAKFGTPVIFYDQLGNGLSTHIPEKVGDESFWTESLFHAELSNLLSRLGLSSYDILGHSWGGMMGSTFAGRRPKGLRKLVLSNTTAINKAWDDAYATYRRELPQEIQDTMAEHEAAGTTGYPGYKEAMEVFNRKHYFKIFPYPDEYQTSLDWEAIDNTVVLTMLGPSVWVTTGTLSTWTAIPAIRNIAVPTLVINGTSEGASDEGIAPFLEDIADVTWVKFHESTHMPHWEEMQNFIMVVGKWLGYN